MNKTHTDITELNINDTVRGITCTGDGRGQVLTNKELFTVVKVNKVTVDLKTKNGEVFRVHPERFSSLLKVA